MEVRHFQAIFIGLWLLGSLGTFENKKVHKHLHLWPLGPHRRRLEIRAGTSEGSTINQIWLQYIRGISHRGPIEGRRIWPSSLQKAEILTKVHLTTMSDHRPTVHHQWLATTITCADLNCKDNVTAEKRNCKVRKKSNYVFCFLLHFDSTWQEDCLPLKKVYIFIYLFIYVLTYC